MPKIPIRYVSVSIDESVEAVGQPYTVVWVHRGEAGANDKARDYDVRGKHTATHARRGFALIAMLAARMGVDVWRDK